MYFIFISLEFQYYFSTFIFWRWETQLCIYVTCYGVSDDKTWHSQARTRDYNGFFNRNNDNNLFLNENKSSSHAYL